jgi:hypothetical protein
MTAVVKRVTGLDNGVPAAVNLWLRGAARNAPATRHGVGEHGMSTVFV